MKVYVVCVFLICAISWTCGVLNQPCNVAQTDCDVDECCSYAHCVVGTSDFKGVCKANLKVGDECCPGLQGSGQCSCSHGMSCVTTEANGISKCIYLP